LKNKTLFLIVFLYGVTTNSVFFVFVNYPGYFNDPGATGNKTNQKEKVK